MNRRDFLRLSALTAGATLIPVTQLQAQEDLEKLSPDNPQAQALKYTEETPKEGQRCNNCVHAKGDLNADWVGCNIFPGKKVAAAGWCNVWAPRAS